MIRKTELLTGLMLLICLGAHAQGRKNSPLDEEPMLPGQPPRAADNHVLKNESSANTAPKRRGVKAEAGVEARLERETALLEEKISTLLREIKEKKLYLGGEEVFPNYEEYLGRLLETVQDIRKPLPRETFKIPAPDYEAARLDAFSLAVTYLRYQAQIAAKDPELKKEGSDKQELIEKARVAAIQEMEKKRDAITGALLLKEKDGAWVNSLTGKKLPASTENDLEKTLKALHFLLNPVTVPPGALQALELDPNNPESKDKAASILKAVEFMTFRDTAKDNGGATAKNMLYQAIEAEAPMPKAK